MNVCRQCNVELTGNFCSNCGKPARVKRINGQYLLSEIGSVLNFQKGILFTIKELLTNPGQNIRGFINEDRNRLVKPIVFVVVCSLIYTVAIRLFQFEDGYVNFSFEDNSKTALLFSWIQNNYGYANILLAIFISAWIKIFFKKYGYNLFEILILLCFVMGMQMLLFSIFGAFDGLIKLNLMPMAGLIGIIYCSWAIGHFFDKTRTVNYWKAFLSYLLGMFTFSLSVWGLGFLIDLA